MLRWDRGLSRYGNCARLKSERIRFNSERSHITLSKHNWKCGRPLPDRMSVRIAPGAQGIEAARRAFSWQREKVRRRLFNSASAMVVVVELADTRGCDPRILRVQIPPITLDADVA